MLSTFAVVSGLLALFTTLQSVSATTDRGLAWATDDRYAPTIAKGPVTWYHHWQNGPVSQLSGIEYVPMYWGPKYNNLWNQRKAQMDKKLPKYLLSFNEPDISSQANMSPSYAAQLFMQEIYPYRKRGVKVGSPAVAWDLDWLQSFLDKVNKLGGKVDFVCFHWYGSWKDIAGFENMFKTTHSRFHLPIWIPELGITAASNPSVQDVQNFMIHAYSLMDSTGYVERASWFGCFLEYQPPDNFATGKNALFNAPYKLSDLGKWYGSSSSTSKRAISARHRQIAARSNATVSSGDDDGAIHCDEICKLRNEQLESWHKANPDKHDD